MRRRVSALSKTSAKKEDERKQIDKSIMGIEVRVRKTSTPYRKQTGGRQA